MMFSAPSTPPVTTVADIAVGQGFQSIGVSPAIDYIRIAGASGGETAVDLATGMASVQALTDVVTPAPGASFTMFP